MFPHGQNVFCVWEMTQQFPVLPWYFFIIHVNMSLQFLIIIASGGRSGTLIAKHIKSFS